MELSDIMHELGIVFHVMDQIEALGKEQQLKKVESVTLEIGEVSGVVFDYFDDCWKWAVKKSELLAGSELKCEVIHAVTICNDCGKTYDTVTYGKQCPHCHSPNTVLVTGNEVMIKEITAE